MFIKSTHNCKVEKFFYTVAGGDKRLPIFVINAKYCAIQSITQSAWKSTMFLSSPYSILELFVQNCIAS